MTRTAFLGRALCSAAMLALLAACSGAGESPKADGPSAQTTVAEQNQTAAINEWFEEKWEEQLARSPMTQTFLGRKTNYDKWDDDSPEFREENHRLELAALKEMRDKFDFDTLDHSAQLSYRLFEYEGEQNEAAWPFRDHWYEFSQFRGPHSGVPAFLINQHRVDTVEDAEAYIARLAGVKDYLGQHQKNAEAQFEAGINPPKWAYSQMIETSRNVISGTPFDDGEDSVLLADFKKKIDALEVDAAVALLVATTAEPRGDAARVVAAAALGLVLDQALLGLTLGDVPEVLARHAATARRGRLVLDDRHRPRLPRRTRWCRPP